MTARHHRIAGSRPIGIVAVTYGAESTQRASQLAARDGFAHIDVYVSTDPDHDPDPDTLRVPVGDRIAPRPRNGCTVGAPAEGPGMWNRAVRAYRDAPGIRVEPWPGSIIDSAEKIIALSQAVPGLRFTIDTGHVAHWGEDPVPLLALADHVQLRQATTAAAQTLEGDVDFDTVFSTLDAVGYTGMVSIEYFDLPQRGWALEHPRAYAVELHRMLTGVTPNGLTT